MRLLSCTYFSSFFAASAWAEESPKSNTIPDLANSACETHISIHAPAKGATTGITLLMYFTVFQSSLPRRKRLNRCKDVQKAYGISILAPAKGATTATVRLKRWHRHFNPRSRKGSDLPQKRKRRYIRIFQSTLPRRERQYKAFLKCNAPAISIHAPAKGATKGKVNNYGNYINFNPRSREGSDAACHIRQKCSQYFNPRSREGSDQKPEIIRGSIINFNPRSREGSDRSGNLCPCYCPVFQSTLPRRERPPELRPGLRLIKFQSTLPRRERHVEAGVRRVYCDISIHAPAKGATLERIHG